MTGLPYVQVGADATDGGIATLLHECGHAFHDHLIHRRDALFWDWDSMPPAASELAAIAMTHLAAPELARAGVDIRETLLDDALARWLPTIGALDAFQQWVYVAAPEDLTAGEVDAAWRRATDRFLPWVDWSGLEAEQGSGWRRQPLLFTSPFYHCDYALAHLGALQLARRAVADGAGAWRAYRAMLELGGGRPLPALYETAGARLPVSRAVVREAAAFIDRPG